MRTTNLLNQSRMGYNQKGLRIVEKIGVGVVERAIIMILDQRMVTGREE